MKVIYITSYKFPSTRAEPYYLQSMAEAFARRLGKNFSLMVRGDVPSELAHANAVPVRMPARFKILWFFFWFPLEVLRGRMSTPEVVFMSNDPYLLSAFVFWRKVARFKYRICSDWHQLFEDWRDRFIAKNSDYLISTTERLKSFLVSICGIDPGKVLVAYGGIDPAPFRSKSGVGKGELRRMLGLPTDSFLVGYIGGFRAAGLEKGLATMIRALPHLRDEVRMVFVGGSKDYNGEYPLLARELGVEGRCTFVGKQPFEKVVEYELALDVLAIPYPDKPHFRNYGFPLKVWEYMASGRPIVYSNLDIIGEVLSGRATTFEPDNVISFAKAIASIYRNVRAAEIISTQNSTDVEAYTWDARVAHILNFIRTPR